VWRRKTEAGKRSTIWWRKRGDARETDKAEGAEEIVARGIFAAGGGNRNSGELQSGETEQRQRRKTKGIS
jgi:hypothetical protein